MRRYDKSELNKLEIRRGYPFSYDTGGVKVVLFASELDAVTHDAPLRLTAAQTADFPPGEMHWEAEDADGGLLATGTFSVLRSGKADGTAAIEKSFEERALEEVEKVLLEASADASINVSVDGKSMTFETRDALLRYRAALEWKVQRQKKLPTRVKVDREAFPSNPPWLVGP